MVPYGTDKMSATRDPGHGNAAWKLKERYQGDVLVPASATLREHYWGSSDTQSQAP
jgi:hypothetical protein